MMEFGKERTCVSVGNCLIASLRSLTPCFALPSLRLLNVCRFLAFSFSTALSLSGSKLLGKLTQLSVSSIHLSVSVCTRHKPS